MIQILGEILLKLWIGAKDQTQKFSLLLIALVWFGFKANEFHTDYMDSNKERTSRIAVLESLVNLSVHYHQMGHFRTDSKGNTIYVSPTLGDLFRRNVSLLYGVGWYNYIHPMDIAGLERAMSNAIWRKQDFYYTYRIIRPGDTIMVDAVALKISVGDSIIGYSGYIKKL